MSRSLEWCLLILGRYDMDYEGTFFASNAFVRRISAIANIE